MEMRDTKENFLKRYKYTDKVKKLILHHRLSGRWVCESLIACLWQLSLRFKIFIEFFNMLLSYIHFYRWENRLRKEGSAAQDDKEARSRVKAIYEF